MRGDYPLSFWGNSRPGLDHRPLRIPRQLDHRPVHLLIKRRAARRELAELIVLLAHQISTKRQRLAHAPLVEFAALQRIAGEIGIRQRAAPDAEETDVAAR